MEAPIHSGEWYKLQAYFLKKARALIKEEWNGGGTQLNLGNEHTQRLTKKSISSPELLYQETFRRLRGGDAQPYEELLYQETQENSQVAGRWDNKNHGYCWASQLPSAIWKNTWYGMTSKVVETSEKPQYSTYYISISLYQHEINPAEFSTYQLMPTRWQTVLSGL